LDPEYATSKIQEESQVMVREAEPQDSTAVQNAKLELQLADAVNWRLDRVQEALERITIPDATRGQTPLDRVIEACGRARSRSVRAELDAEVASMLIDNKNLAEARALIDGRLTEHARHAHYHAATADAAARELAEHLAEAVQTIEQAQSLLSLAAQPTWSVDHEWLCRAVARSADLRCRIAEAEEESQAATETAFMASAHTVTARVAHGLAESDLERAELGDQIAQIEAALLDPGENCNEH
jgi:hypothetical protein